MDEALPFEQQQRTEKRMLVVIAGLHQVVEQPWFGSSDIADGHEPTDSVIMAAICDQELIDEVIDPEPRHRER